MKLKRYKKKKFSSYISFGLIIIFLSLIVAFVVIDYFSDKCNDILLPMAESQTRKVVTTIINSACDEELIRDNLYVINKDSNDEIKMITYNSFEDYLIPTKELIRKHQNRFSINKKWFELKKKAIINHTKRFLTIKRITKER